MPKAERKYLPIWKAIKDSTEITEIELPNKHLYTQDQLLHMMKTIRKAVINEKCVDYSFKNRYPWSELNIVFERTKEEKDKPAVLTGTIKFELTRDTTDVSKLFAPVNQIASSASGV